MKRIIICLLLSVVVWGAAQSQTTEPTLRKIYVSSELGYPLAPASSEDGTLHTGVLSARSVDINALLPKYKIGGVPNQQIWNDKDFFGFYISTDTLDLSEAVLSYIVDGFPEERISFDAQSGKFLFYPDSTDIAGFTLTLIADAGEEYIVSQDVHFGVEPQKGNMFSYLSDETKEWPDPDNYLTVTGIKGPGEYLNGEDRSEVMSYSLSGVEIVFDTQDPSDKFAMLYGMVNLKELNIYAEKVVFESQVSFHSTNVNIYADEVVFKNGASLRTTSTNDQNPEKISSGDVTLFAGKLTTEQVGVLFYMNANDKKGKLTSNIPGIYHTAKEEEYVDNPYAWLHPNWLMPVVNMLNDAFIDQQSSNVGSYCDYYLDKIKSYRNSDYWERGNIESIELEALASEMLAMNSKIKQRFDYFGNPHGFMPMLSFEINQNLYKNEIDRSIKTLYFTYWMRNAGKTVDQQIAACKEAVELEKEQLMDNINLARELASTSNRLQYDMTELVTEMDELTEELDWYTEILLERAENNVAKYNKINRVKKIVSPCIKVVGMVGGAIVGANTDKGLKAGFDKGKKGGETAAGISDGIFDFFNPPLDKTYADNPPYAEFYNTMKSDAGNFSESVSAFSGMLQGINMQDLGTRDGIVQIGGSLYDSSESMMSTISKFDDAITKTEISNEEVQAELNKLIAESPEYSELVEKVSDLNVKKENTILEMYSTFNQLISTTYGIQKGIVTIDALNITAFEEDLKKDSKLMLIVDNMERNAKNRLLESHYYMGRSYEYSFLEPYKISLNTSNLFGRCAEIAENAQNSALSESDFNALKQLYMEDLALVEKDIIDIFNNNNVPQQKKIFYTLDEEQIEAFNSGAFSLSVNLFEDGKFPLSEEDIRILDININSISLDVTGKQIDVDRYFDFSLIHEGNSRFIKNDKILGFIHKNNQDIQPIKWSFRCFQNESVNKEKMSPSNLSLLNSLFSKEVTEENVFAKPAAWGYLTFERKNEYNEELMNINVKKLQLEIIYEAVAESRLPVAFVSADQGLQPNIQLTVNGIPAVMANGFYAHIFDNKSSRLQLKAPERFGEWQFEKWVNQDKRELSTNSNYDAGFITSNTYFQASYKKIPAEIDVETVFDVPKEEGYLQIKVENIGSQTLEWKVSPDEKMLAKASDTFSGLWFEIKAGKSGLNSGYITVRMDENKDYNRTGILRISSNAEEKEILIRQDGEKGPITGIEEEKEVAEKDQATIYMRENGLCYVDIDRQVSSIHVELYDLSGQTVKQVSIQSVSAFDIDMSDLNKGAYIIHLKYDEKEQNQKLVKY